MDFSVQLNISLSQRLSSWLNQKVKSPTVLNYYQHLYHLAVFWISFWHSPLIVTTTIPKVRQLWIL